MDETGRGTSTYDGGSIALVHRRNNLHIIRLFKARLFLLPPLSWVESTCRWFSKDQKSSNVSVKEVGDKVIFMRNWSQEEANTVLEFMCTNAEMPNSIVLRAAEIMTHIWQPGYNLWKKGKENWSQSLKTIIQLACLNLTRKVLKNKEMIEKIDIIRFHQ